MCIIYEKILLRRKVTPTKLSLEKPITCKVISLTLESFFLKLIHVFITWHLSIAVYNKHPSIRLLMKISIKRCKDHTEFKKNNNCNEITI